MKHKTFAFFIMATLTIAVFAFPADAAEVEGTNFNDTYAAEDKQLKLAGAGLLRHWGFKAYTGALQLEQGVSVDDVLSDAAKRMELEYFRANKGKDFGPVTDKSIAKNVDDTTYTETGNGGSKPDALHNAGPHGVPVIGL